MTGLTLVTIKTMILTMNLKCTVETLSKGRGMKMGKQATLAVVGILICKREALMI
jgi:hypothetical protein